MPILVRPVREQLEHDRIIRLLEAKWRKTYKVDVNPGEERNVPVKVGGASFYPDLVLTEEGARKPRAVVEVETGESVNHLEARAQWAHLAKSRSSLYLYVPAGSVETATRLASDYQIPLAELWTYMVLGDQVRFTSIIREDGPEPADVVEIMTVEHRPPVPIPVEPEPTPAAQPASNGQVVSPRKLATPVRKAAAKAAPPVAQTGPVGQATSRPAPASRPVAPGGPVAAPAPAAPAPAEPGRSIKAVGAAPKAAPKSEVPAAKKAPPKPPAKVASKAPAARPVGKTAAAKPAPAAKPTAKAKATRPAPKVSAKKATPRAAAPARPSGRTKVAAPARPSATRAANARSAARPAAKRAPVRPALRAGRTQKRK